MRRSLAVLVLLAHASAAAHLAFAAHAVADSGAVVEAQAECPSDGHGSTGIAHGHELQRHELACHAVALLRAPARTSSAAAALVTLSNVTAPSLAAATATPPLDVLSVAPKSSPPV